MSKIRVFDILPYLLPIFSYLLGKQRSKMGIPKRVAELLRNEAVIRIISEGVEVATAMRDKSDEEKREYVRAWAKSELYATLGEWLPDSVVNFLIENVIIRNKG